MKSERGTLTNADNKIKSCSNDGFGVSHSETVAALQWEHCASASGWSVISTPTLKTHFPQYLHFTQQAAATPGHPWEASPCTGRSEDKENSGKANLCGGAVTSCCQLKGFAQVTGAWKWSFKKQKPSLIRYLHAADQTIMEMKGSVLAPLDLKPSPSVRLLVAGALKDFNRWGEDLHSWQQRNNVTEVL